MTVEYLDLAQKQVVELYRVRPRRVAENEAASLLPKLARGRNAYMSLEQIAGTDSITAGGPIRASVEQGRSATFIEPGYRMNFGKQEFALNVKGVGTITELNLDNSNMGVLKRLEGVKSNSLFIRQYSTDRLPEKVTGFFITTWDYDFERGWPRREHRPWGGQNKALAGYELKNSSVIVGEGFNPELGMLVCPTFYVAQLERKNLIEGHSKVPSSVTPAQTVRAMPSNIRIDPRDDRGLFSIISDGHKLAGALRDRGVDPEQFLDNFIETLLPIATLSVRKMSKVPVDKSGLHYSTILMDNVSIRTDVVVAKNGSAYFTDTEGIVPGLRKASEIGSIVGIEILRVVNIVKDVVSTVNGSGKNLTAYVNDKLKFIGSKMPPNIDFRTSSNAFGATFSTEIKVESGTIYNQKFELDF